MKNMLSLASISLALSMVHLGAKGIIFIHEAPVFPRGEAPTPKGVPTYYLAIFSENCVKFWPGGAHPSCILDPLMGGETVNYQACIQMSTFVNIQLNCLSRFTVLR